MVAPSQLRGPSRLTVQAALSICLAVLLVAGVTFFVFSTQVALTITLGAALVAMALDRLVLQLVRRGWRRGFAVATVVIGVLVCAAGVVLVVVPPVISQARALVDAAPDLVDKIRSAPAVTRALERLHQAGFDSAPNVGSPVATVLEAVTRAVSVVGTVVSVFALSLLMLVFGPDLVRRVMSIVSANQRERYQRLLDEAYESIGAYLTGLATLCTINGVVTATFLAVARVPFFLPLALLTALLTTIPYAGPAMAAVIVSVVALATGGGGKAVACAVFFVVLGQLQGSVLEPVVYRRAMRTNPLVTTLAVLFLAEFKGIPGAILAVPTVAVLQVLLRAWLAARQQRLERAV